MRYRIRLRAIPPTIHPRQLARPNPTADAGEAAWRPHVVAQRKPLPACLSRQEVITCLKRQIDDLTQEISMWRGEFGEAALTQLFDARARLGDILQKQGRA